MLELEKQGNLSTYDAQRKLIEPLMYMQERGMRMDIEGMQQAKVDAGVRITELTEELHKLCGFAINADSPKQLADYFYRTKRCTPYYKNGKVTTDIDALKRLSRKGVREASLMMEIRKWSKLKSTYFEMKLSSDGRLRSAMNPVGTTTGRLSSSKDIFGEGGNVQNLPPVFKRFILADEGYVAYDVDLSGADNRVVAYIAPEPLMRAAFEAREDLHKLTASLIFGIPKEDISDEAGSSPLGGGVYSQRFWGKKANHSLNYGLGYKSFALRFELPEGDAKFIVDRYHQAYPGVRQYHAWIQQRLGRDRTLENCFGRKRLFLDRWGDELFKEAYSFIPQSTVADKINRQGILFLYYNQASFHAVELLNQVHDSLVFQLPLHIGWDAHASVLQQLLESLGTPVPWHGTEFIIPADVKMGLNLGTMEKVKNAQATGLANQLHDIYTRLRTERTVPLMDGDIDDLGSTAEEDEPGLGA
jgi:DNA polymerase-1